MSRRLKACLACLLYIFKRFRIGFLNVVKKHLTLNDGVGMCAYS